VVTTKVNEYHLILDLNGILLVTGEGPNKFHLVVLKNGLKELLYICVKKIIVYIWSSMMRRNFVRHLEIIE
jgi:hypothetical protein